MNVLAPIATGAAFLTPLAQRGLKTIGQAIQGDFRALLGGDSAVAASPKEDADRASADEGLSDFHRLLMEQLQAAGIDPSVPIEITLSPFGNLTVINAHPQILEVENLLANDERFARLYDAIASSDGTVRDESEISPLEIHWDLQGATARSR